MHTFEGRRTEDATITSERVPHHPDNLYHPFMFMHHGGSAWECAVVLDRDGKRAESNGAPVFEVLPALRKFKIKPGVHGIRQGKHESDGADWLHTKSRRESEGWQFLPKNAILANDANPVGLFAFGVAVPGGYVVEFDGQRGVIYADAWSRPVLRPGQKKVIWEYDPAGFAQFRRDLVKRGVVSPPDKFAVDALIRVQEKRAGRRITDVHIPAVAVRVEAENVKLHALGEIARRVEAGNDANNGPDGATAGVGARKKKQPVAPRSPLALAKDAATRAPVADGEDDE